MRILVTGASGLVGRRLVSILVKAGHAVVATSRNPESLRFPKGVLPMGWDGQEMLQVPGQVDAIVHLMGEPIVGSRWTAERKQAIRDSRIVSSRRIAEFVRRRPAASRPSVVVSANAVGYYGDNPAGPLTEASPPGTDFLAQLCQEWEAAITQAPTRVVTLRCGHILSRDGGYLGTLLPFARVGLGGPLGTGRQPMPWLHIDDLCGIILWSLSAPGVTGAYNAVAPHRLAQRDFVKALNQHTLVPNLVPIPALAMKVRFGEVAVAMLGGQDVIPERLELEGYEFGHPTIEGALADLLKPRRPRPAHQRAAALAKAAGEGESDEEEEASRRDAQPDDSSDSDDSGALPESVGDDAEARP